MKRFLTCLIISGMLFSDFGLAHAQDVAKTADAPVKAQADKHVQDTLDVMLGALVDGNYAEFLSVSDENFKEALSPDGFQKVLEQLAPRLKVGYESSYLGVLKQKGFDVHLWRISYKDNGDDALAEISLKGDKVGGFYLR